MKYTQYRYFYQTNNLHNRLDNRYILDNLQFVIYMYIHFAVRELHKKIFYHKFIKVFINLTNIH